MPALKNELGIIVYAPVLVDGDPRPVSMVHGMEQALPGLRLEWMISDEGQRVPLPQRDEWLTREVVNGEFPLLCNDEGIGRVSLTGWEGPASLSPGGHALLEVHAAMTQSAVFIAAAGDVLEAVAERARAFWGHATPFDAGVEISEQTVHPRMKPGVPPRGLPALRFREELSTPEIPHRLGWLNYWSAATARTLGFPDLDRDRELLSRARRTATGGWVVTLTDKPLDLDRPEHLDALLRAYERFPEIGGRNRP